MATRTRLFQMLPWDGGLNTSTDEALIPPSDLTVADNLLFSTSTSRKKREGVTHNYENQAVVGVSRASSTTTRTLIVNGASFFVGEQVTVSGGPSTYNGTFTILSVATTTTANDTFTYTGSSSLNESTTADTAIRVSLIAGNSSVSILTAHDYWFGATTRSQRLLYVRSDGAVCSVNSGTRVVIVDAGTAWTVPLTSASIATFANKAIIAVSGTNNVMRYWAGSGSLADVPGTPPKASFVRVHQGRILCNDKANPDLLHYSPVGDYTLWNGSGDSGAIPIGEGDGDPEGITGISPTFKGDLFIGKKTNIRRMTGPSPEEWQFSLISDGLGFVSHQAICAVDQDDLVFVSDKGIHSIAATMAFGDFADKYLSAKIQPTFRDNLTRSRLKYAKAVYLNNHNTVFFAFTESSSLGRTLTSSSVNNAVYAFHVPKQAWYRWPDMPCEALMVANDSDEKRLYLGSHKGTLAKGSNGLNYDIVNAGTHTGLKYTVTSGVIFPSGNPYDVVAFKKFILFYKPRGTHTITGTFKVDNYAVPVENQMNFSEVSSADLLGSTFVLGTSVLGYSVVLGPYTRSVDGFGHGAKITLTQTGIDEEVELQGFAIEYEVEGTTSESNPTS